MVKKMLRLKNKVIIVTGGGGNIGQSICKLFSEEGAIIIIFEINPIKGKIIVDEINKNGKDALFLKTDVTKIKDIKQSIATVIKKYGHIDGLINNVGGSEGVKLEDINEKIFYKNLNINLKSAVFCTKYSLPYMIEKKKGSIVFISSINAIFGGFSEIIYSTAKGGIHSLIKTLTGDYSKYGIRFNVLCVGSIPHNSPTWKKREIEKPGIMKKLENIYPLKRVGKPIDIANAALFFVSDESSWITGTILPVDGGITATGLLPGNKWWESL